MTRSTTKALAAFLVLALLPALAHAQATGTISGVVSDASGAAVPGASVEATNRGTGLVRATAAGADGFFTIPLLPPGLYDVKGSMQGFGSLVRQGIRVNVSETARVNLGLSVGNLTEDVTVVGDAPLVETGNATLGIVIDEKKIVDLPLNGRSFAQLGTLVPGVVAPPVGLGGASGDATPGGFGNVTGGFNVNGMRNQSNNFVMDGATNNDTFNTGFVLRPPPDAIQEFKILTHSYNAEYGRNAGSVVSVVTKSGTNDWHGAAWEFNRDDALQARNYFAPTTQPKPRLKQNQFGATLGGPLLKNKLSGLRLLRGPPEGAGDDHELHRAHGRAAPRGVRHDRDPRPPHRPALPRQHDPLRPHQPDRDGAPGRLRSPSQRGPQPLHGVADGRGQPQPGGRSARLPLERQALDARPLPLEQDESRDAGDGEPGGPGGQGHAPGRDAVRHLRVQPQDDQRGPASPTTASTRTRT